MLKFASFLFLFFIILFFPFQVTNAQLSVASMETKSEQNVEQFLMSNTNADINSFMDENMSPMTSVKRAEMFEHLKKLRQELKPYLHGIGTDFIDDTIVFNLSSPQGEKELRIVMDHSNDIITKLEIVALKKGKALELENLEKTFKQLEKKGFSGLVHVRIKGDVYFEKGFGWANKNQRLKNNLNTVFGIGSRPIDFTIAAIFLLKQKGQLSLDDTIDKYFKNVPDDKTNMTIQHLLNGESGLQDFFHNENDWDADLRYINRNEAVKRLLSENLLFEPGTKERHSHAAFGLLAAIIEVVSEEPYYTFLRKNFLDPAKMMRTGEYGESRGLKISDFAVGHGISSMGLPNIPPNWGKTSWLVKGSGGMYSTLNDLLQFYKFIRSGKGLNGENNKRFKQATVNVDGSDRGFELFNIYFPSDTEIILFLNEQENPEKTRELLKSLENLATKHK